MSYILDALQRADAERTRGGVPTLHARQASSLTHPPRTRASRQIWLVTGAVLLLVGLGSGLWFWHGSKPTVSPVATLPQTQPIVPTPMPAPAIAPVSTPMVMPSTTPVPTAAPPVPPTLTGPAPVGVTARPKSTPSAAPSVPPPPQPTSQPTKPQPSGASTAPKNSSTTAPVAPAAPMAPLLGELPEPLRREIPALKVTGAVYSNNPAQRLLLVNGLVLTQGSLVAPELTLVEIRSGSSEFSFRGTLFRVAH